MLRNAGRFTPEYAVIERLALRGNIHIDSFGGSPAATKVYCTVECNGVEKVSAKELTSAGADNFFAVDILADFNLGTANELKVYLWVDQGDAVVSVCQLWQGIGASVTGSTRNILVISHKGFISLLGIVARVGTGTPYLRIAPTGTAWYAFAEASGSNAELRVESFLHYDDCLRTKGTVATDLNYLSEMYLRLRSLQ